MRVIADVSIDEIINSISKMDLDEIERIKESLIKRELYFKPFIKDNIENIVEDFKKEGYSQDFLKDLEDGLKKSSIYAD